MSVFRSLTPSHLVRFYCFHDTLVDTAIYESGRPGLRNQRGFSEGVIDSPYINIVPVSRHQSLNHSGRSL